MLTVEFDYAQTRLKADMLSTLASGADWLPTSLDGLAFDAGAVWIEPVKQTVMLLPAPMHPAWVARSDGIYTKYVRSNFVALTDSSKWKEIRIDDGGPFLQHFSSTGNPGNLTGITPTQPVNQPMVVEWHQPPFTIGSSVVMECGWSDGGNGLSGVSLRLSAGGRVEVWKDGVIRGTYSFSASRHGGVANGHASGPARGFVSLMLIPFRDRELLVHSSAGGAFCHVFEDLTEGEAGQVITGAGKFWFNLPAPQAQAIRIAPIQFAASGSVYSRPTSWRFPPPAGSPSVTLFQSLSQEEDSLVSASVVASSVNPAHLDAAIQVRADLTGGPSQTPFLYGVRAWFAPETALTVEPEDGPLDGGDDLLGATLSVADTVSGAHMRLLLKPSETIANLRKRMGRAIRVSDEAGVFLSGISEAPTWSDGITEDSEDVDLVVRDGWKAAEEYVFADPIPLDGLSLYDAYRLVVRAFGGEASVSEAARDVKIGGSSSGNWECLIEVGQRASVWLNRLHGTYAATWAHWVSRDGKFTLLSPEDMPTEAAVTLYRSVEDAVASGVEEDQAWRYVYRSAHRTLLEPEANEVWVMGQDLRSRRPILVAKRDEASADPTLAEDARPDNWLGRIRKVAYGDPSLTSKAACLEALDLLYQRLSAGRQLIDVECEFLDGLWKGDLVVLAGGGEEGEDVTGRIKAFQGDFRRSEAGASWRPFQYVLEVGDLVAPLGDAGFTAPTIKANRRARLLATQKQFGGTLGESLRVSPQFVDS